MQSRFFKVILEIVSFSAHHLVAPFSHRSSLTVTELSDYITRRKNQKNLNSQKRYKMLVLVLGYALDLGTCRIFSSKGEHFKEFQFAAGFALDSVLIIELTKLRTCFKK